jgi:tRNA 2-thiouridine synthesizing protein A
MLSTKARRPATGRRRARDGEGGGGGVTQAQEATVLDLAGLKCPMPALKTRKALKTMAPGARIAVICTDPLAAIDIPNLVRETGDVLERIETKSAHRRFIIRKAG